MEYLFIYGTLLDEKYNPVSDILKTSTCEKASGFILGRLYDLGDYPAAVGSNNLNEKVYGKLLEVKDSNTLFPALDAYEGAGKLSEIESGYSRKQTRVILDGGDIVSAWTYLYSESTEGLVWIQSGDYLQYLENKETE
ncbi:MAG: gamma-glutamylcyclotransferase family protein [Bacteroidales bacterium]